LEIAAHGFRRAHLDAVAVVPRHANRPDDVLDDDDERLVRGHGDRLRELARLDDVCADVARESEQRGRSRSRRDFSQ
jgi:hypothetical protein